MSHIAEIFSRYLLHILLNSELFSQRGVATPAWAVDMYCVKRENIKKGDFKSYSDIVMTDVYEAEILFRLHGLYGYFSCWTK